jgi:hypothetical protein
MNASVPPTNPLRDLCLVLSLAGFACILTVVLRLYPIMANFTPVGALCLFLGARVRRWWGLAIPLGLMLGTDYLLWLANPAKTFWHTETPYVYGSFALMFALGWFWVGSSESPVRILGAAVAGGLPFFFITNFGSWYTVAVLQATTPIPGLNDYSADVFGLLLCYWRAIPFHRGILYADIVFSAGLFGAYALATRWMAEPASTQQVIS